MAKDNHDTQTDTPVRTKLADSFQAIYTAYHKKSFLFVLSYVHDELVAEDIASASLIRLWECMRAEEIAEGRVLPLLLTILKNKALDYLKHEEVRRKALESMADWQHRELELRLSSLEACDPEGIFSDEVRELVRRALDKLPPQTRQAFVLSRMENLSNREIAQELSISVKGVEYHISKALKALRIALKDYLPLFYFFFYHV